VTKQHTDQLRPAINAFAEFIVVVFFHNAAEQFSGITLVICEKRDNFTIGIGFCRYCKITPSWGISNLF